MILSEMDGKIKLIQRDKIIDFLRKHPEGTTVREILITLNINSPTKRISELVKMGYPIKSAWKTKVNSNGEKKRYKVYWLRKEARKWEKES